LVAAIDAAITAGRIQHRPMVLLGATQRPPSTVGTRMRIWRTWSSPGSGRSDGGLAWPSDDEIDRKMSTLAHSAVHVNICSTMAIDGAAFDRLVITPTFLPGPRPERRLVRAFYRQEHWQPIARSGG
jgi:hypothetical protein